MKKKIIIDNEDVSLWFYPQQGIVHHEVKRPIMGDKLKSVLDSGYQTLRKTRANKWLSDDRCLGAFSREDQEWCEQVWFPKTRDAGWQFWAIILPETVLGQMSLQYFETKYSEQGITARYFKEPNPALSWLMEQPNSINHISSSPPLYPEKNP